MKHALIHLLVAVIAVLTPRQSQSRPIYINSVNYLESTGEFYLDLPFNGGYSLFQKLENMSLENPQSNDEWVRRTLPLIVAQKYFDLDVYRKLLIFNREHELVCKAVLAGVELFADFESYFVVVLKPENGKLTKLAVQTPLYVISEHAEPLLVDSFVSSGLNLASINQRIEERFQYSELNLLRLQHTLMYPANEIFSVLSFWQEKPTFSVHSYLLETRNEELRTLLKLSGPTNSDEIMSILSVPIMIHGKPVLILSLGVVDTDAAWHELAVYNGHEYELLDDFWVDPG